MGLESPAVWRMRGANVVAGCRAPKPPLPDDADADFGSSSGDELRIPDPTTIEGIPEGSVRGSAVRHELDLEDLPASGLRRLPAEHEGKVDVPIHAAGSMRAREHHGRVRVRDAGELPVARAAQPPRRAAAWRSGRGRRRRWVTPGSSTSPARPPRPWAERRGTRTACCSLPATASSRGRRDATRGRGTRYAHPGRSGTPAYSSQVRQEERAVAAVDPGDMLTDYVLKANWRRESGMRYHPAVGDRVVGRRQDVHYRVWPARIRIGHQAPAGARRVRGGSRRRRGRVQERRRTGRAARSSRTGPARSLGDGLRTRDRGPGRRPASSRLGGRGRIGEGSAAGREQQVEDDFKVLGPWSGEL